MRDHGLRLLGYGALVAAVLIAPHVVGGFRVVQLTYVGVFAIALLGLNILTGITGQISLGHGGFMAIGAYVTAILSAKHDWYDLATIPVAAVIAGAVGFLFGFPALRLAGVYLALATFALAVIIPSLATSFGELTGGTAGILMDLPTSPTHRLNPDEWLYYVTWAIAVAGLVSAAAFVSGKRGRALRAVRENELAAVSSGVSLTKYKTLAFGVSALYAGIAGSLYAILNFIVTPGSFPITLSILLLAGLVIGGAGSFVGVLVGAAFVEFVPLYSGDVIGPVIDLLQKFGIPIDDVDPTTPGVPSVVYGAILLLALFLMPRGAAGLFARVGSLTKQVYSRLSSSAIGSPPKGERA